MTETKVTRIGVASLAGVVGVVASGVALVFGWPLLFLEGVVPGMGVGLFGVYVVAAALGGLVTGGVTALLYNLAAAFMGGVRLDLEETPYIE